MSALINEGDRQFIYLLNVLADELRKYSKDYESVADWLRKAIVRINAVIEPTAKNKLEAISLPEMPQIALIIKELIETAGSRYGSVGVKVNEVKRLIDEGKISCSSCDGKGEIMKGSYHREEEIIQPYVERERCPTCGGMGYLEISKPVLRLASDLVGGLNALKRSDVLE